MTALSVESADLVHQDLCEQLRDRRHRLGMSQEELAERSGLNRATVIRSESGENDPSLRTVTSIALALNLMPVLSSGVDAEAVTAMPDLVHRGAFHARTKSHPDWKDRRREAALAKAWEAVNASKPTGVEPVLAAMVNRPSQAQATAAATVVQWLGSDVGFRFLTDALEQAGYAIVEKSARK